MYRIYLETVHIGVGHVSGGSGWGVGSLTPIVLRLRRIF